MIRRVLLFLVILPALIFGACSSTYSQHIEWIPFVQFHGITYRIEGKMPQTFRGDPYEKVQFRLDGHIFSTGYQSKDGDAAYLDAGTQMYTVKGYRPSFRLADPSGMYYDVFTNPQAKIGETLLDITGKVVSITVQQNDPQKNTALGVVQDPSTVTTLVQIIVHAPVNQESSHQPSSDTGKRYFLLFALQDNTQVFRGFLPSTKEIDYGIFVPEQFLTLLESTTHVSLT